MEFITKHISKKVLAMVLTIAVLFTSVSASLFAFADVTEPYDVMLEEPAIPMTESTLVKFSALNVEMTAGAEVVSGADLTWSTAETEGIIVDNDKQHIAAFKKGVYPVTVSDGTNSVTLYVVVKTAEEEKWTLYSADWNNEEWNPAAGTSKALPEGWLYQIGGQKIGLTTVLQQTTAVPHSAVEGISSDESGILVTGNAPIVSASGKVLNDTASVFFTLNNTYVNAFKNYTVTANMLAYVDSIAGKLTDRNGTMGVGFFVRAVGADTDGKFTVGGKSSFDTDIFAVNVNPDVNVGGYAGHAKFSKFMRATAVKDNIYKWPTVDKCSAESGVIMPASLSLSLKLDGTTATLSEAAGDFSTFEKVTLPDRTGLVGIYVGYADGNYALVKDFSVYLNNTAEEAPEACIACDVLPHSFTKYTYNNDQTCMKDGTETAECDYGCGTTDTKTVAGTKEPHAFTVYENTGDATPTDRGTETSYCDNGCGSKDVRDVSDIYKVEASSPAIPVNTNTATKVSDLEFEIDGSVVPGAEVTFALAEGVNGVTFADGVITAGADTGVFPATVTSGEKTITVYIVAKHQYDDHWYLYDEDFTKSNYNVSGYGEIKIPDNWAAQYTAEAGGGAYYDNEYVAPYSTTANPVTEGIIPFYNFFEEKGVEVKTYGGFFTLKNEVVNSFADYTIYTKMLGYNHENERDAGIGLYGRAETIDSKLADITTPDEMANSDRFSVFYVNNTASPGEFKGVVSMAIFGDKGGRKERFNKLDTWENLPLAKGNSNTGVYNRFSLKYDGEKATFTNLTSPKTDSVTYDLSTNVGHDANYDGKGAVGVYICRFSGSSVGHNSATAWYSLRRFSVALNNTKYDCPLHTVITPEVDPYPGAEDDQIAREPDFEELELDPPAEELGTADSGTGAAGGSSAYLVTEAAPAIPMINTTYINFSSLVFEWDGSKVGGSTIDLIKLQEPTDGVTIDNVNKTITANKVGVYPATVIKGQYQKTVYIVVKTYNDNRWYLYDQDFTAGNWNASGYGTIAVPDGWQAQYAKDGSFGGSKLLEPTNGALPWTTHVAPYSTTGNVTKGILPFYNMFEETNDAEHKANFGFFTLNDKIVNKFADYTIIANTTTYNPYGDNKESGVGLYGRVHLELNKYGKITNWNTHDGVNMDSFSVFYVNNGTGDVSKNVYNIIVGDGAYRQKNVTKISNFGNVATTGADNIGVQLNMRLKYEGDKATFIAGNQYVEHDMSKDIRYNKFYDVPGGVGFYAGGIGAPDAQNTTWSAIERFSVALNNEKVDGANVNCPYFYKTANFDAGAEVEEEEKLEQTLPPVEEKKVRNIKITAGFRIQYYVGEEIDLNGGQITVTYSDGKKETIDITEDMISGFDTSAPGTYTVTITYGDKTATFEITVVENPNVQGNAGDNNEPQQTVVTYDYVQDFTMIIIIALAAMMLLLIVGAVVIILVAVMSKGGNDDDDDLDLDDIDLDDYDLDDYDLDDYDEL